MQDNLFSVSNKVIIITGGLGLIGLHLVNTLVKRGATICILDLLPVVKAKKILNKKINKKLLANIFYFQADITNKSQLLNVRDKIILQHKRIDVLINNAALNPKVENIKIIGTSQNKFEEYSVDLWRRELDVNLTGTMLCCQLFGSKMKSGSSIINFSSLYGVQAPDKQIYPKDFFKPISYGVSKAGIISLTQHLASHWGEKNIRVNCLVPGGVENNQQKTFIKKYKQKTMLGRMAQLSDFDGIIIYLASKASSYATGASFYIDGGFSFI